MLLGRHHGPFYAPLFGFHGNVRSGWLRVLGWGLAWKPVGADLLFSERMGYRGRVVGPWFVRVLRP